MVLLKLQTSDPAKQLVEVMKVSFVPIWGALQVQQDKGDHQHVLGKQ